MEQFSKHRCRVNIRPTYKGRIAKHQALQKNGEVYIFEVLFEMGCDEKYPDEYAMSIVEESKRREWVKDGIGWISSGDLEFL